MARNIRTIVGLICLSAVSMGTAAAQTGEPQVGDQIASFEMSWPRRSAEEVARRAQAVVEVVTGQRQRSRVVVRRLRSPEGPVRRWQLLAPEAPALRLRYIPDYDELRVLDVENSAITVATSDVGPERAVAIAREKFGQLAERNIIQARHYNWQKADVASTWFGEGSTDGRADQRRRIEYRITVRREINGIELANSGLRFAISASGGFSGIRIGGVAVASDPGTGNQETPRGRGRFFTRRVATADLAARFTKEVVPGNAQAHVAWARLMYVMPEDRTSAVVEPLYVVSYALELPSDEGQTVVSRRKTIGYSLAEAGAAPIDLTPPVRPPRPDGRVKPTAPR